MPERADFKPERADFRPEMAVSRPERAWGDLQKKKNEQTNEQMDEQKSPCVLQDFVPFVAAAQKAAMKLNLRGQISGLRGQI